MSLAPPTRAKAISFYNRAQCRGLVWAGFAILILVSVPFFWDVEYLTSSALESLIVFGVATFPTLLGFGYAYAQKRKRVQDLREDVIFGKLRKADVLSAIRETEAKMKLQPNEIQVYITNERDVNASAISLGVGSLFHRFRAVHIHRGTLHALDREELITVIAHEFAHLIRYPQRYHELLLINLLSAAFLALFILSKTHEPMFGVFSVAAYFFIFQFFMGSIDRVIEHLCDDVGAEIGGIEAALRAEYLVSYHHEVLSRGILVGLRKKLEGTRISAAELNKIITEVTPFSPIPNEILIREIEGKLQAREKSQSNSFFGFLQSIVFGTSIESRSAIQEQVAKFEGALKADKIDSLKFRNVPMSFGWFGELIQAIHEQPNRIMFSTPEDISDRDATHPGPRKRIVYLWNAYVAESSKPLS